MYWDLSHWSYVTHKNFQKGKTGTSAPAALPARASVRAVPEVQMAKQVGVC